MNKKILILVGLGCLIAAVELSAGAWARGGSYLTRGFRQMAQRGVQSAVTIPGTASLQSPRLFEGAGQLMRNAVKVAKARGFTGENAVLAAGLLSAGYLAQQKRANPEAEQIELPMPRNVTQRAVIDLALVEDAQLALEGESLIYRIFGTSDKFEREALEKRLREVMQAEQITHDTFKLLKKTYLNETLMKRSK